MSSTAAPRVGTDQAETSDEAVTSAQTGAVSFADLVRVHHLWERSARDATPDEKLSERWHQSLAAFERQEGSLRYAYWATRRPSAVALTMKERPWPMRLLLHGDAIIRLHRVTDWVAKERAIADLMHHCDTLAIKVSEVLQSTPERIAMQWLYSVQSHLLGFVERTQGKATDEEIAAIITSQSEELIEIENYYARAGEKAARIVYFWGMVTGAFYDGLLAAALLGGLWWAGWLDKAQDHAFGIETFFVCYVAGGLGAIVSVLMRMSSRRFNVDYEVGRMTIHRLGSFRPFIGAVFGVALYFLIRSGIPNINPPKVKIDAFFFFASFAFLAGFNERWTNVLFGRAEQTLAGRLGGAAAPAKDKKTTDDEDADQSV